MNVSGNQTAFEGKPKGSRSHQKLDRFLIYDRLYFEPDHVV